MKYIIDKNSDKLILRDYLVRKLKLSSRLVKYLKKFEDGIHVNGANAHVDRILCSGDVLELNFNDRYEDVNEFLIKTEMDIDILFEDENMTVVNKAPNVPTHQSINHYTDTLANALAYRYKERAYVFRAITRLDKDTSGVVITANNRYFAELLSSKLREGLFNKEYIAIVKGRLEGNGVINAPIKRAQDSIVNRIVSDDGEYAVTEYEALYSSDELSVLKVHPITGRTHQIRVHMSHLGHPLLGDEVYGSNKIPFEKQHAPLLDGQMLHAKRLTLTHPVTGERMTFECELPDNFKKLIEILRKQ